MNQLLSPTFQIEQALGEDAPNAKLTLRAVCLIAPLAVTAWLAIARTDHTVSVNGRLRPVASRNSPGPIVKHVASQREGRVVEVAAAEGDRVEPGQVLLRTCRQLLDNQIAKKLVEINASKAELEGLRNSLQLSRQRHEAAQAEAEAELSAEAEAVQIAKDQRKAAIRSAELALRLAKDSWSRAMAVGNAIPESELVQAEIGVRTADAEVERASIAVNDRRLETLRQARAARTREHQIEQHDLRVKLAAKESQLRFARLDLEGLRLELDQTLVCSPIGGTITELAVGLGDFVVPGPVGITVVPDAGLEFQGQVPSEDIADLNAGMPARVILDASVATRPDELEGELSYISADSEIVKDSSGEESCVYKIRIALDDSQLRGEPAAWLGRSGQAQIITSRSTVLQMLRERLTRSVRFQ